MLVSFIRKVKSTLKHEGPSYLFSKISKRLGYLVKRKLQPSGMAGKDWKDLKDKYKGERAFLIGNGPSINKLPLYLLQNEHTMCFNRFSLMYERLRWRPDFYVISDNLVLSGMCEEINDNVHESDYIFLPDIHFRGEKFFKHIKTAPNLYWFEQLFGRNFSDRLPKIYPGGSVIYEGFQILNYLGFKEVYFIGVDMNFKLHNTASNIDKSKIDIVSNSDDDPNHFDPRYFGKGRKYHQPEERVINNILADLHYLSTRMGDFELNIRNAGIESKVESFEKVDLMKILGYQEGEIDKLFDNLVNSKTTFKTAREFEETADLLETDESIDFDTMENFICSGELGSKLIKKLYKTHLALGPHDNRYYFAHRKIVTQSR